MGNLKKPTTCSVLKLLTRSRCAFEGPGLAIVCFTLATTTSQMPTLEVSVKASPFASVESLRFPRGVPMNPSVRSGAILA